MMKFGICTTLSCAPSTTIDLPIKSWGEVKEWFVKWDTLHYTLDGEQWHEVDLGNDPTDVVYWKRPVAVKVYDPETFDTVAEDEE
jgi:hypothetical protein